MIGALSMAAAAWELMWWSHRRTQRTELYRRARAKARELARPLVVVGSPDRGPTAGYGCGDLSIDIGDSACPRHLKADITKTLPIQADSVVVFASCVLEYVDDYPSALRELERIAGPWLYIVRVEPWTLTAHFYPGARRTLPLNRCPP